MQNALIKTDIVRTTRNLNIILQLFLSLILTQYLQCNTILTLLDNTSFAALRTLRTLYILFLHQIGAEFLESFGFPSDITIFAEGHVNAKRYLVYKDKTYYNRE